MYIALRSQLVLHGWQIQIEFLSEPFLLCVLVLMR
jgi:hypothetical protein